MMYPQSIPERLDSLGHVLHLPRFLQLWLCYWHDRSLGLTHEEAWVPIRRPKGPIV